MVHERLYRSDHVTRFSVGEFVQDIVADLIGASARGDIGVCLDPEAVTALAESAAPIALMVDEVVTDTLKHAFAEGRSGRLPVSVKATGERFCIQIEDHGLGMPNRPDGGETSFAKSLIPMPGRQLRAVVTRVGAVPSGTRVLIDLPVEPLQREARRPARTSRVFVAEAACRRRGGQPARRPSASSSAPYLYDPSAGSIAHHALAR